MPAAAPSVELLDPSPLTRPAAPALSGIWRGDELGHPPADVVSSGWPQLDRELPGGGWPTRSLTELLAAQPALLEWRLLGPALRQIVVRDRQIVIVAPPRQPYLPGLRHEGLDQRHLVWVQAAEPAERLWVCEQLIKANACGAIVAWLPQARPEQLRRLQVCAQSCEGPVFLWRPEAAQHEPSAAPLRVLAGVDLDWELRLRILKRRGPTLDEPIALPSVPGSLARIITPRLARPSRLFHPEVPADAVGRPVVALRPRRHAAVQ